MKWTRVNNYSIRSGPWSISKYHMKGEMMYALWHADKAQVVRCGKTADEVKDWLTDYLQKGGV